MYVFKGYGLKRRIGYAVFFFLPGYMIVNAIFLLVGQLLCFFLITFFGYSQVFLSKVWLANH
jgi:hypothetical protein